jgi:hypothetical protein
MSVFGNNPGPYTSRAIDSETARMILACERLAIIVVEMGVEAGVAGMLRRWVGCDLAMWLQMVGQYAGEGTDSDNIQKA